MIRVGEKGMVDVRAGSSAVGKVMVGNAVAWERQTSGGKWTLSFAFNGQPFTGDLSWDRSSGIWGGYIGENYFEIYFAGNNTWFLDVTPKTSPPQYRSRGQGGLASKSLRFDDIRYSGFILFNISAEWSAS